MLTESELVKGCIREDKFCQRELFCRYSGKMMTVCLRYARHRHEAEDMLQDAFIRVFDHLFQFEHKGSLEGWIRRIVVTTALKYYQRVRFQREETGSETIPDQITEPDALSNLGEAEILKLIAALPDGYRLVFNLYVMEGYSHKEIAEQLHIQESTSRSQLVKARGMLQEQIIQLYQINV